MLSNDHVVCPNLKIELNNLKGQTTQFSKNSIIFTMILNDERKIFIKPYRSRFTSLGRIEKVFF